MIFKIVSALKGIMIWYGGYVNNLHLTRRVRCRYRYNHIWLYRDVAGYLAKGCVWGLWSSLVLSTKLFPRTQLSQPGGAGIFLRGHLFSNLYRIIDRLASAQVLVDCRRGDYYSEGSRKYMALRWLAHAILEGCLFQPTSASPSNSSSRVGSFPWVWAWIKVSTSVSLSWAHHIRALPPSWPAFPPWDCTLLEGREHSLS